MCADFSLKMYQNQKRLTTLSIPPSWISGAEVGPWCGQWRERGRENFKDESGRDRGGRRKGNGKGWRQRVYLPYQGRGGTGRGLEKVGRERDDR